MAKLIPFLTVRNALEAIELYKEVFNAKIQGDITMLENIPGMEKHKNKVGHCSLKISESVIFVNDFIEEYPLEQGEHVQLVLDLESEEFLRTSFAKLAEEGKIVEELQEVFWGSLFGTVKDKYNITWQLYYGRK